jgi:hypothetical protein
MPRTAERKFTQVSAAGTLGGWTSRDEQFAGLCIRWAGASWQPSSQRQRRTGVYLACALMVLDMIANWAGNWSRIISAQSGLLAAWPWLITAFGLLVLATPVPRLRPSGPTGSRPGD